MLTSGAEILHQIDGLLQPTRSKIHALNNSMIDIQGALAKLQQQELHKYRELADIRLELIEDNTLFGQLEHTDKQAKSLLEERQEEMRKLEQKLLDNQKNQDVLEQKRNKQLSEIKAFSEIVDKAEAATMARLEKDAAYIAQDEKTESALAVAERARHKTDIAEQDYQEKSKPYHNDKLFMYLWQRGYGTDKYHAGSLVRMLDGWVARLVKYQEARVNYTMLSDIPKRLDEHADNLEKAVQLESSRLDALELAAMEEDGVTVQQKKLDSMQEELRETDEEITQTEAEYNALTNEQQVFFNQADDLYRKATNLLVATFKQKDMRTLRRDVERTATADDDHIIVEITRLHHIIAEQEDELLDYRNALSAENKRVQKLQGVRHKFKKKNYDSYSSFFKNSDHIIILLNSLLSNDISYSKFWKSLAKFHIHKKRRRRYSSSRRSSGNWGSGSWGGGSSSGGFGGGGFGTGGSFGGGSFRTGGGF